MINILGVRIDPVGKIQFKNWLLDSLSQKKIRKVYKLNPEFLTRAYHNQSFLTILNQSNLNIVDGIGIRWAAKFISLPVSQNYILRSLQLFIRLIYSLPAIIIRPSWFNKPVTETLPGVECFKTMLEVASQTQSSVFFFGGRKETITQAVNSLRKEFPKLKIAGYHDGYNYNSKSLIKNINQSRAKILFVALGSPLQEIWINNNSCELTTVKIIVGEGGTLDRVAQPSHLAPNWINKIGLEWMWRLFFNKSLTSGRSRFGRFWNSIPRFIAIITKEKYRNG